MGKFGKFNEFVHRFIDADGNTKFAVGKKTDAGYWCPTTPAVFAATGIGAEVAQTPAGLGGYDTYLQAYIRAKYIFARVIENK